jgi:hypothetical protein
MNTDPHRINCTTNIEYLLRDYANDKFPFTFGDCEIYITKIQRTSTDRIVITMGDGRQYRIAIANL